MNRLRNFSASKRKLPTVILGFIRTRERAGKRAIARCKYRQFRRIARLICSRGIFHFSRAIVSQFEIGRCRKSRDSRLSLRARVSAHTYSLNSHTASRYPLSETFSTFATCVTYLPGLIVIYLTSGDAQVNTGHRAAHDDTEISLCPVVGREPEITTRSCSNLLPRLLWLRGDKVVYLRQRNTKPNNLATLLARPLPSVVRAGTIFRPGNLIFRRDSRPTLRRVTIVVLTSLTTVHILLTSNS